MPISLPIEQLKQLKSQDVFEFLQILALATQHPLIKQTLFDSEAEEVSSLAIWQQIENLIKAIPKNQQQGCVLAILQVVEQKEVPQAIQAMCSVGMPNQRPVQTEIQRKKACHALMGKIFELKKLLWQTQDSPKPGFLAYFFSQKSESKSPYEVIDCFWLEILNFGFDGDPRLEENKKKRQVIVDICKDSEIVKYLLQRFQILTQFINSEKNNTLVHDGLYALAAILKRLNFQQSLQLEEVYQTIFERVKQNFTATKGTFYFALLCVLNVEQAISMIAEIWRQEKAQLTEDLHPLLEELHILILMGIIESKQSIGIVQTKFSAIEKDFSQNSELTDKICAILRENKNARDVFDSLFKSNSTGLDQLSKPQSSLF